MWPVSKKEFWSRESGKVAPPQWEKGGNFKKLKISKITRYNVYGL